MRVLICGSRTWEDYPTIEKRITELPKDTVVIHGACRGADQLAGVAAKRNKLTVEEFPADWKTHGKAAGIKRNLQMLDTKPDLVIAFQEGNSRGTEHTIQEAKRRGIQTEVFKA